MKNKIILVTALCAVAFAGGCSKQEPVAQQLDKIKTKTEAVAQDMQDYTYAQKSEFVKYMRSQLRALDRDMETLAAKIESSSDAVKANNKPKLQALRNQTAQLSKQLDTVESATESAWNDVKADAKKAYGELKESFQQARQWMSDKIAP